MSATKILWAQILIVFAVLLATLWGATQWTAWRLGFQPQLGPPWFMFAGMPVYLLPIFFLWWFHFDAYAPSIFLEGAAIAVSGGFASIGIAIGMSVWRAREAKTVTTYGSARWRRGMRFDPRDCWARTGSCSAVTVATTYDTTDPSTCSVSLRPAPARVWALSFLRC